MLDAVPDVSLSADVWRLIGAEPSLISGFAALRALSASLIIASSSCEAILSRSFLNTSCASSFA